MAETGYKLEVTAKCRRLIEDLQSASFEFADYYQEALVFFQTDPYNRSRIHNVKKLINVPKESGEFRLRIGRWRFRYDIEAKKVILYYCGLRREDTYRV
jgi:mRNA-degrading endonuclease RelE of RelBE toxin-antitoxin system